MSERKNIKRNKSRPHKNKVGLVQTDTMNRNIEQYKLLDNFEIELLKKGMY